jgi:hypothetical protein
MRRIKVFDRLPNEPGLLNLFLDLAHFFNSPQAVLIAGETPSGEFSRRLIPARVRGPALLEVVNQMNYHVRRPNLFRKGKVRRGQHVPVEAESQFHRYLLMLLPVDLRR